MYIYICIYVYTENDGTVLNKYQSSFQLLSVSQMTQVVEVRLVASTSMNQSGLSENGISRIPQRQSTSGLKVEGNNIEFFGIVLPFRNLIHYFHQLVVPSQVFY